MPNLDAAVPRRLPLPDSDELALAVAPRYPVPTPGVAALFDACALPLTVVAVLLAAGAELLGVWPAVAAWALAAGAEWAARRAPRFLRLAEMIGVGPIARGALRAAALVAAFGLAGLAAPELVGLLAVLVCALGAEVAVRAIVTVVHRGQPPLVYWPQSITQPPVTRAYAWAYGNALAAPGPVLIAQLLGVVAILAGGVVGVVPALVVIVGWGATALFRAMQLIKGRRSVQADLTTLLAARRPIAVMYVSGGLGQVSYLLNPWLDALNALDDDVVVVVRQAGHLRDIETPAPLVLYTPSVRPLIAALPNSATVAFYPANGGGNTDFWRETRFKHVFLGHGDSDKATSATPIARLYDEVWVAGPLAAERYRRAGVQLPDERFVVIGRPQSARLHVGARDSTPVVVGYAPTFEGYADGVDYSSLDRVGESIVRELLNRRLAVAFRPHPATGVQRPSMLAARQRIVDLLHGPSDRVSPPSEPLWDFLNGIDLLITDVSSVSTDFLYTGRPVIVVNTTGCSTEGFLERFPSQRGCYVLAEQGDDLPTLIAAALGADPLALERRTVRAVLHGDVPEGPLQRFVNETRRLAGVRPEAER